MPIEQILIRCDQERTGAAGRINNPKFGSLLRCFVFQQFADSILDDVIDDVSGCVINAARFLDLWFVFDLGLMAFGEPDDLAEKLLIDLS